MSTDNKTAQELLIERYRRQLSNLGQYPAPPQRDPDWTYIKKPVVLPPVPNINPPKPVSHLEEGTELLRKAIRLLKPSLTDEEHKVLGELLLKQELRA